MLSTGRRNTLAQFIRRVTNPLALPLRRVVPAIGGLDLSPYSPCSPSGF